MHARLFCACRSRALIIDVAVTASWMLKSWRSPGRNLRFLSRTFWGGGNQLRASRTRTILGSVAVGVRENRRFPMLRACPRAQSPPLQVRTYNAQHSKPPEAPWWALNLATLKVSCGKLTFNIWVWLLPVSAQDYLKIMPIWGPIWGKWGNFPVAPLWEISLL